MLKYSDTRYIQNIIFTCVSSALASSWPLNVSRKYVATCVKHVATSAMNVIYRSALSFAPVRNNISYRDCGCGNGAITFGEVLGDYQVLCTQHKGPRISRCFEMYFFHVLSRLRRSAVKGDTRRRCFPLSSLLR